MRRAAYDAAQAGLASDLPLTAIVSMGGMGKTSLARMLVSDCLEGRVSPSFDSAVWVSDQDRPGTTNHSTLMAEISRVLASSLDYTETLASLSRTVVPFFADACVIYQLVAETTLRRLALAHADSAVEQLMRETQRFEIPVASDIPAARVVRTRAQNTAHRTSRQRAGDGAPRPTQRYSAWTRATRHACHCGAGQAIKPDGCDAARYLPAGIGQIDD
jgi:hypothetical protein